MATRCGSPLLARTLYELGEPTKAREGLGWVPGTSFTELVSEMMREDLKSARRDSLVKRHGFQAYDYHE